MPGVSTRQMKCSGVWPSGTAYVTFEDVKVPKENLIGEENQGFRLIGMIYILSRYLRIRPTKTSILQYPTLTKSVSVSLSKQPDLLVCVSKRA